MTALWQALLCGHTAHRIEQLEFPGEDHSVAQLGESVVLLHVLEPLEVQSQDLRQLLDPQPLGGLLLAAALLTVVLGLGTQSLVGTEHAVGCSSVWSEDSRESLTTHSGWD